MSKWREDLFVRLGELAKRMKRAADANRLGEVWELGEEAQKLLRRALEDEPDKRFKNGKLLSDYVDEVEKAGAKIQDVYLGLSRSEERRH